MVKRNRRPPKEMYELARRKFNSHEEIIKWFFTPLLNDNPITPQDVLNMNGDFLVMESLGKLPDKERPNSTKTTLLQDL